MSFDVTKPFCSKPMQLQRLWQIIPQAEKKNNKTNQPTNHPRVHRSIVVPHPLNYYHDVEVSVVCITRASDLHIHSNSPPGVSGTQNQLQDWIFNTQTTRALKINNIIPLVNRIVFQDKLLIWNRRLGKNKLVKNLFINFL